MESQSQTNPLPRLFHRLIGSVGLGGPAAFYLIQNRPQKKPHDHHGDELHDDAEKKEAVAPAKQAEPQPDRDAEQKTEQASESKSDGGSDAEKPQGESFGEPPSNVDQVRYPVSLALETLTEWPLISSRLIPAKSLVARPARRLSRRGFPMPPPTIHMSTSRGRA